MADDSENGYDLTGLVQVVFSEDRLKHLLQRIHTLIDKQSGRLAAVEAKIEQMDTLRNDFGQFGSRLALLDETIQRSTGELEQTITRNYEELSNKNRTLLKQTESKIQQSRGTIKGCSDFLRRELAEAMEANRKERTGMAANLSELVRKEMHVVNQQLGQVKCKYSVLEEQYNRNSALMTISTTSTHAVQSKDLRESNKSNASKFRPIANLNSDQQSSSSSDSQPEKDEELQPKEQRRSRKQQGKPSKNVDANISLNRPSKATLGSLVSRVELIQQKQSRMEMMFNRNPRAYLSRGSSIHEQQHESFGQASQQNNECKQELEKVTEKCLLLQEQNKSIFNQLETMRVKVEHDFRELRRLSSVRTSSHETDSSSLLQLKLVMDQMRTKLESKIDLVKVEALQHRLNSKLEALQIQLTEKSDKEQVKRALVFIEGKLKDVILLVSQTEKDQKDALFTKTMVKCLSCDKQVDKMPLPCGGDFKNWRVVSGKTISRAGLSTAIISRKNRKDRSRETISRDEPPTAFNFDD